MGFCNPLELRTKRKLGFTWTNIYLAPKNNGGSGRDWKITWTNSDFWSERAKRDFPPRRRSLKLHLRRLALLISWASICKIQQPLNF